MVPLGGEPRPVPTELVLYTDIFYLGTLDKALGDIRSACVAVRGNLIDWVGPEAECPAELRQDATRVVSLVDQVVIPGLVNTHHHMFQTLTRCVAQVRRGPRSDRPGGGPAAPLVSCRRAHVPCRAR